MALPLKVGTLLYFYDRSGRVLLMRRTREPNKGLWSPPGGKVHISEGESPFAAALREAGEETGVYLKINQLKLVGFISEQAYEQSAHWHLFLFKVTAHLSHLPPAHEEGEFQFFRTDEILGLDIPDTDRHFIWPTLIRNEGRFFSAHCRCQPDGSNHWTLEQS